jgi:hypothetical protein
MTTRGLVGTLLAANQACFLKLDEVAIDRSTRDFAIPRQRRLVREAPVVGVMAVCQVPEDYLGDRANAALLYSPIRCAMTHCSHSSGILEPFDRLHGTQATTRFSNLKCAPL